MKTRLLSILLAGLPAVFARAENTIPWDLDALRKTPATFPAPEVEVEGLRSLYFEGPPLNGKPTKIFALYGIPRNSGKEKLPGIILLHGGGGTAFADWVKVWRDRGYAAIAIDHGGKLPLGKVNEWLVNPEGGPHLDALEAQVNKSPADQWMYHAVAGAMLAHSLLASFPEVDADLIGLSGISWGGVVASTVAGLDDRLKFVIPVYGSGYFSYDFRDGTLFLNSSYPAEDLHKWRSLWDPANYLKTAKAPIFWLNGSNDFAFTLNAQRRSSELVTSPQTLLVKIRMPHGHEGPARDTREIFAFADSIVKKGPKLPQFTRHGYHAAQAWADLAAPKKIREATLHYTTNSGRWQDRQWLEEPAEIDAAQGRVTAKIPSGTKACFFTVTNAEGLSASTEYVAPGSDPESQP